MPVFRRKDMIVTYAPFIERHGLIIWWEIDFQTMTLKLHKVAQLRRVEAASLIYLVPFNRFVFPTFIPLC
ncbi:hypothetical protein A8139_10910 [Marinomonas primoryensis]|uniref:Uncharacterized protein n=1 Tax=Marinomonas primoryensis TaxID=178399 RepID=A0A2Z4PSJ5_9GAMM|nr:hypothetical protein A8139_10910 [Marinomonas primoryensis]